MYQKNKRVRENALTCELLGKGLWVLKFLRGMITQGKEEGGGGVMSAKFAMCG